MGNKTLNFPSFPSLSRLNYFDRLNPNLIIEIIQDLMITIPFSPIRIGDIPPSLMVSLSSALSILVKAYPGFLESLMSLARIKYLFRDFVTSQSLLNRSLALSPLLSEPHLLSAAISLETNDFQVVLGSLNDALSSDFEVRLDIRYHLLRGKAFVGLLDWESGITVLKGCLEMRGVKDGTGTGVKEEDRVSVYLGLVECYRGLNQKVSKNS